MVVNAQIENQVVKAKCALLAMFVVTESEQACFDKLITLHPFLMIVTNIHTHFISGFQNRLLKISLL